MTTWLPVSIVDLAVRMVQSSNQGSIHERGMHISLLRHLCRELEDVCPRLVSRAAQDEANRLKLGSLRSYHWDDQVKKMKDVDRKTFHWEHVFPVYSLVGQLQRLDGATHETVAAVLATARVAWITKAENIMLDRAGARSRRVDPWATYRSVGIVLLDDE